MRRPFLNGAELQAVLPLVRALLQQPRELGRRFEELVVAEGMAFIDAALSAVAAVGTRWCRDATVAVEPYRIT